jgi:hypothetical protein
MALFLTLLYYFVSNALHVSDTSRVGISSKISIYDARNNEYKKNMYFTLCDFVFGSTVKMNRLSNSYVS